MKSALIDCLLILPRNAVFIAKVNTKDLSRRIPARRYEHSAFWLMR